MRTRTPPPDQIGFEKSTEEVRIKCTPTEKLFWQAAFGKGQLSERAREILHGKARELTKMTPHPLLAR